MHSKVLQKGFGIVEVIIVLAVLAVIGAGGWYVWQTNLSKNQGTNNPPASSDVDQSSNNQNVFKIPELGAEFTAKDNITPLHFTFNYNYKGVNYKLIRFSTQQLVDKGSQEGKNDCEFHITSSTGVDHPILTVSVYNSETDLLKVENEEANVTAANIKPEKGYFTIKGKIFVVPQAVQRGS